MSRLQKLGAADTNLAPWGSDGHMYRFSCRAPLANAPAMTQHFESVADQPTVAVEQVWPRLRPGKWPSAMGERFAISELR